MFISSQIHAAQRWLETHNKRPTQTATIDRWRWFEADEELPPLDWNENELPDVIFRHLKSDQEQRWIFRTQAQAEDAAIQAVIMSGLLDRLKQQQEGI